MNIDEQAWQLLMKRLDTIDKATDAIFQKIENEHRERTSINDRLTEMEKRQRFHNGQHDAHATEDDIKRVNSQLRSQWITVFSFVLVSIIQIILQITGVI